jgi:hypothetical protein
MDQHDPQVTAKVRVLNFFNDFRLENVPELTMDHVYIVWFCYTLKSWKALVSTVMPDGTYYEVTYNADTNETYLDVYSKVYNFVISDKEDDDQLELELEA